MKKVLVTGATSGFGFSIARRYAQEGHHVFALGRRKENLLALQKEYPSITIFTCDIQDIHRVQEVLSKIESVDILINNAGLALGGLSAFDTTSETEYTTMIQTNITGFLHITHAVLKGMKEKNYGDIINISSVAGTYPYPNAGVYGATKAFISNFSLSLRAELFGKNIRVTSIEPGMAETEFSTIRFNGDTVKAHNMYQGIKALQADDIADIIYYTTSLPHHININRIEIMPTQQTFAGFSVHREKNSSHK
ncbi:MAG: SDR family NAD(P)-dependent oxidoreductase [Desulfovibrionaceae bacterium]